jgi:hypothetical protein
MHLALLFVAKHLQFNGITSAIILFIQPSLEGFFYVLGFPALCGDRLSVIRNRSLRHYRF